MHVVFQEHPRRSGLLLSLILLVMLAGTALAWADNMTPDAGVQGSMTAANLQKAYSDEMNANSTYLEYAQKADEEGYTRAASLFRALARAEEAHADMHLNQMKKMQIVPKMEIEQNVNKTTSENLAIALAAETRDADMIYPGYKEKATQEGVKDVAGLFGDFAKAAAVHVHLLKALQDKPSSWSGKKMTYYVCPVCGNILTARLIVCPICQTAGKKFIKTT